MTGVNEHSISILGLYPNADTSVFTGPMTVNYELTRVFRKKGITVNIVASFLTSKLRYLALTREVFRKQAEVMMLSGISRYALWVAVLKRLGLVKGKVVYLGHGCARLERLGVEAQITEKFLLSSVDQIFVVSSKLREILQQEYPFCHGKIAVIPNGISEDFFVNTPTVQHTGSKSFKILTVGGTRHVKGLDFLINSLKNLEHVDWQLDIVGFPGDAHLLIQRAIASEPRINFAGPMGKKELINAYSGCDLFVLPSRYEPFGMAALEAMAAGRPVIISDRVGLAEFIEQENVVHFGDTENLGSKIAAFYRLQAEERLQHGRRGRERAKALSWQEVANRYCEHLKFSTTE